MQHGIRRLPFVFAMTYYVLLKCLGSPIIDAYTVQTKARKACYLGEISDVYTGMFHHTAFVCLKLLEDTQGNGIAYFYPLSMVN